MQHLVFNLRYCIGVAAFRHDSNFSEEAVCENAKCPQIGLQTFSGTFPASPLVKYLENVCSAHVGIQQGRLQKIHGKRAEALPRCLNVWEIFLRL